MTRLDWKEVSGLAGLTIQDPTAAARQIMATRLDHGSLWQALFLVSVLSVLATSLLQGGMPILPLGEAGVPVTPFAYVTILASALVIMVFALVWTGRAFGGQGSLTEAIALVVWLEVLAIMVRAAQSVAFVFGPFFGGVVSLLGLALLLWCLINFINELHRFESLGKAALTLVLAIFGIGVGVSIILSLIGVAATNSGGL